MSALLFRVLARGVLLAAVLTSASSGFALTVRVESTSAAPRLLVDGKPVRARMFFGIPASAPIAVSPHAQQLTFEFAASGSAQTGTMHFRFGAREGSVDLDEIHVVDLDDSRDILPPCTFENGQTDFAREWTVWPPGSRNTVGKVAVQPGAGREGSKGLHVELKPPADGQWPDFHIYHQANLHLRAGHHYRVALWARATPARQLTVAFYKPGQTYVHLGGPPGPFETQIKLAAGAGVNFVSFPIDMPWPRPGHEADWSSVDLTCEQVLRANPHALLLPRMGMMPPSWWQEANPDDVMRWKNGRKDMAVVASPRYRHDAAERLRALVEHLEATFGDHVAGYHPCGQNTGEWFYEGTWERPLSGYAPADERAFRLWLKTRYRTDEALRTAWQSATVTLATASVPAASLRHASPSGVFRDPVRERALCDWAEFQQDAMSDCVAELAHAVRQASRGKKLVVFFYGYIFEFAAVPTGPAVAGHYALRRALDCPDIDVLCSPISYFDRGLGQSAAAMTAAESVALARKMWLYEDDTRTYLGSGDFPGQFDAVSTLEDTNKELIRNVGQEAVRNFATWWMDLGATGWFNDPRMWEQMKRLEAIDRPLLAHPSAFRPEVAAVIDERAMRLVAPAGVAVTRPGIYEVRAALGRMGAPYGQYLLDDLLAEKVPAKLVVMLNAWRLTAAERAALASRLRGKTVIWCYAPGYLNGDRASREAMRALTGFDLVACSAVKALASPTSEGRHRHLERSFGSDQPVRPLFAASGLSPARILATYPDGSAAVAIRRESDGTQIFSGPPGLTSELLRLAAREAGVHLFTDTDCNVYARGPFVVLHASQDGPVVVNLPARRAQAGRDMPWTVNDVMTGDIVGRGRTVRLSMKRGDTRILRYE
ncbi:MAG: beta-galactosidase [Isosphaeraceae bacterium]